MGQGEERAYLIVGFVVIFVIQMALGLGIVVSTILSLALMFPVAAFVHYAIFTGRHHDEWAKRAGPDPYPQQKLWETSGQFLNRLSAWGDRRNASEVDRRSVLMERYPDTWSLGVNEGRGVASRLLGAGQLAPFNQEGDREGLVVIATPGAEETRAAMEAFREREPNGEADRYEAYEKAFFFGFSLQAQGRFG